MQKNDKNPKNPKIFGGFGFLLKNIKLIVSFYYQLSVTTTKDSHLRPPQIVYFLCPPTPSKS